MKVLKTIGNCCLVFLAVLGVCISLVYAYYVFFIGDKTVGVNYVGDQIGVDLIEKAENLSEEELDLFEERWFMEVNYYSNSNNTGIELQELNFNYFTDYTLTSDKYRSTGMQYIGDYKHKDVLVSNNSELNNYVFKDFYYYDTSDGISFSGYYGNNAAVNTLLKRSTSFTIKIDNRAFEIQLDKSYDKGWWIFKSTHYYTWSELFESVMNAVESNSVGFGDYYIRLDLSDFFTIREYNLESGKLKTDNVTDIIKNYAMLKFHYDENGAKKSSQSLFNCISCNSSYGLEENIDTTYWQERYLVNIDSNDLNYRYSETYGGYFVSLNVDTISSLKDTPRSIININIDLDTALDSGFNIVGIDYNGFENLPIETLSIIGSNQTFHILDSALNNTGLKTLKHSKGITLNMLENAINSNYVEVVLWNGIHI